MVYPRSKKAYVIYSSHAAPLSLSLPTRLSLSRLVHILNNRHSLFLRPSTLQIKLAIYHSPYTNSSNCVKYRNLTMDWSSQKIVVADDPFDRLPEEIVLSIFGKLGDAKSLCSSMAVCKRFRSIAPQVDQIFLPIPQKKPAVKEIHMNSLKYTVFKALMKPFHFISQMIKFKSKSEEKDLDFYSYYIPNEILKSFEQVRGLHLMLPSNGNRKQCLKAGKNSTTFLKWRAEFGRELHSCVMLGAKSLTENIEKDDSSIGSGQASRVMGDDDLKLRIVWTISCLIAASARHYLIQDTVKGLRMIENVVVSDETDQGRMCMNKQQIEEIREFKGKVDEMGENRSRFPALRMKMWYLDRLELPSGKVLVGATLVLMRPAVASGGGGAEEGTVRDADMVADALGGGGEVGEAVRTLMVANKCYVLEMNSF